MVTIAAKRQRFTNTDLNLWWWWWWWGYHNYYNSMQLDLNWLVVNDDDWICWKLIYSCRLLEQNNNNNIFLVNSRPCCSYNLHKTLIVHISAFCYILIINQDRYFLPLSKMDIYLAAILFFSYHVQFTSSLFKYHVEWYNYYPFSMIFKSLSWI